MVRNRIGDFEGHRHLRVEPGLARPGVVGGGVEFHPVYPGRNVLRTGGVDVALPPVDVGAAGGQDLPAGRFLAAQHEGHLRGGTTTRRVQNMCGEGQMEPPSMSRDLTIKSGYRDTK